MPRESLDITEAVITMARHTLRDSDGLMAAHTNARAMMLALENTVAITSVPPTTIYHLSVH